MSPAGAAPRGPDAGDFVWFESGPGAVGLARAEARAVLAVHGVDGLTITQAELLVSELVTNVVRHTDSQRVGLHVAVSAAALHVSVREDASSTVPGHAGRALTDVPITATSGRGLGLVDWLASSWGITRAERVTTTWFEIATAGAGQGRRPAGEGGDDSTATDESLRRAHERSQLLLRITEALGRAATAEQVAGIIAASVRDHVGAVFTGIALADRAGGTMHYLGLDPLPQETAQHWERFPLDGANPVSRVAIDAEPLFHETPEDAEAAFPGIAEHMRVAGTRAIAHLPLTSGGVTFGTLAVAWSGTHVVDAETRALLLIVAGFAAQALARR